jgi:hypothetical protein
MGSAETDEENVASFAWTGEPCVDRPVVSSKIALSAESRLS